MMTALKNVMMMQESQSERELRRRYNPDGSDLRRAQLRMLDMLRFIDRICREHGLRYWIDYGTLLGAMRHGGFIPWDDDTDISMPREDALRLQEIMGDKVHDGHIVLQTPRNDPNYNLSSWFTLRDLETEYHQNSRWHNMLRFKGLQVDIFMVEENLSGWWVNLSEKIQQTLVMWPSSSILGSGFMRPVLRGVHCMLDSCVYSMIRKIRSNDGNIRQGVGSPYHTCVPIDAIYPLRRIKFEGYEFNAPNDPKGVLDIEYGNWLTIPDESNRRTHEVEVIFLD